MKRTRAKGFWGVSRRLFRWTRLSAWTLILLILLGFLYLNTVGLPDFIKRRVVAALEAEGLSLEFSRLRLKGFRHVVVRDLHLGITNSSTPLTFSAKEAGLGFEGKGLRRFNFRLDAISLKDGQVVIEALNTNGPARSLQVSNLTAQLTRMNGDQWQLESLHGHSLGAEWQVFGSITNIFALSRPATSKADKVDPAAALRAFLEALDKVQFAQPPRIAIALFGDVNELSQFKASISIRSQEARTPWANVSDLAFRTVLAPSLKAGEQMQASVTVRFQEAVTEWATARDATFIAHTSYPLTNKAAFESLWRLQAAEVTGRWFAGQKIDVKLQTRETSPTNLMTTVEARAVGGKLPFGQAAQTQFEARLNHAYPLAALNSFFIDLLPIQPTVSVPRVPGAEILKLGQHWAGDWRLNLDRLAVKGGAAGKLTFSGDVRERPDAVATDDSWGFWKRIAPLIINWRAEAADFQTPEARIDRVAAHGEWRAPRLSVAAMDSQLYDGSFHLEGAVDVSSRALKGQARLDFDLTKTAPFLDAEARGFLKQFTWEKPPKIEARLALTLPPWTNAPANLRRDVLQSAVVDGALATGPSSFRGVTWTELTTHFSLTNFHLRLPDLAVKREEGALNLDYTGHAFETPFRVAIRSGLHPWAALPLLDEEGQEGLKFVEFTRPPLLEGVLTGDLQDPSKLLFTGNIAITNFLARKEPFLDVKASFIYSNQWIYITEPLAHRTTNEVATASWASIDLQRGVMFLTNGFSTTDPEIATRVIGPVAHKAIEPYVFKKPPTVRAHGIIPLKDEKDADIFFQIAGDDLAYWRFNLSKVTGGVYWHGDLLDVTNIHAGFYGGEVDWEGHFKFLPNDTADYRFKAVATNADLSLVLHDLFPGTTNRLDGTLHGRLTIVEANSTNLISWRGFGDAQMKDGFLWDIPIFGMLSGPLDAIVPGFGKSRISAGQGTFGIERGKVLTRDMELRAPAFRLRYDGTVDFDGNLDAKVEAQMFRDTWILGRAMSAVLWPLSKAFESQITGSLSSPKSELAHIPKIMLFPLRPIQTLKELLPKEKEKEK